MSMGGRVAGASDGLTRPDFGYVTTYDRGRTGENLCDVGLLQLRVQFTFAGTWTGRLSSTGPNLANLPRKKTL